MLADSNNNRLVEMDINGKEISTYNYANNLRIYQVKEAKNE
jgi:hypothetical protein